jgi:hypothetical protein
MPISFSCPYCGKQTLVADHFAGKSGPCASCGQTITIPGSLPGPAPSFGAPPPQPSSGRWTVPLVIALAAILPLVACGGILVALLLPAIQASREAARRMQCNNNLRQIALGLQNYHDTYKVFPAGASHAGPASESARIGPSWWVGTLPFCEERAIFEQIQQLQRSGAPGNGAYNAQNFNANIPGAPLESLAPTYMRCPSSPLPITEQQLGPIALPTYAGIAGGCDIMADSTDYQGGSGAAGLVPPQSPQPYRNFRKGVGHVPGGIITASGMLPTCEHVGIASCTDGTSNTMIVGEQSDWLLASEPYISSKYHGDPGWDTNGTGPSSPSTRAGGGFVSGTCQSARIPNVPGAPSGPEPRFRSDRGSRDRVAAVNAAPLSSTPPVYDCYNITTVRYPPNLKRVLGATPHPGCSEDHGINNPLQSAHPGGLQVAMTDGAVQFISLDTDLAVLLRLAIRDDGQSPGLVEGPRSRPRRR